MTKETVKRINQLYALGFKFNGQDLIDSDFNVHWTELICDTDEEFNTKLEKIKKEKERRSKMVICPFCGQNKDINLTCIYCGQ